MKRNIYFTSDWHLGHKNIIRFCNRPFSSIEEMHKHLIMQFNRKVRPEDVTYFLGDMGFGDKALLREIMRRLNGTKILIKGNHDRWGDITYYNCGFSCVVDYCEVLYNKHLLQLNHRPFRTYRGIAKILWIYLKRLKNIKRNLKRELRGFKRENRNWTICGHVHQAWKVRGKNINVGVDVWKFRPVGIGEIFKIINKKA